MQHLSGHRRGHVWDHRTPPEILGISTRRFGTLRVDQRMFAPAAIRPIAAGWDIPTETELFDHSILPSSSPRSRRRESRPVSISMAVLFELQGPAIYA